MSVEHAQIKCYKHFSGGIYGGNYYYYYSMEQSPSSEDDQFSQLTKKFPAFYGTRGFFTVLTSARHLFLT
jgi:hypothetical protein